MGIALKWSNFLPRRRELEYEPEPKNLTLLRIKSYSIAFNFNLSNSCGGSNYKSRETENVREPRMVKPVSVSSTKEIN